MHIERRLKILKLVNQWSLEFGEFTLASGKKSPYYFNMKKSTLLPESAVLIGEEVYETIKDLGIKAVGGIETGAIPIAAAVAIISYFRAQPISAFFVRHQPKSHGDCNLIEGHLPQQGGPVVIVDDVTTTGDSVTRAIKAVEQYGCKVVKVITLVDRHQGGSDKLRIEGYDLEVILHANTEGKLSLEPKESPKSVGEGLFRR